MYILWPMPWQSAFCRWLVFPTFFRKEMNIVIYYWPFTREIGINQWNASGEMFFPTTPKRFSSPKSQISFCSTWQLKVRMNLWTRRFSKMVTKVLWGFTGTIYFSSTFPIYVHNGKHNYMVWKKFQGRNPYNISVAILENRYLIWNSDFNWPLVYGW